MPWGGLTAASATSVKLSPTLTLRDEPFRQRRFGLFDPTGVWIDVVEQIEPAPGWWGQYLMELRP
jgi:hypothetical protein